MDMESNDGWNRVLDIFPDMDLTAELDAQPELRKYIKEAINKNAQDLKNPLEEKGAPELDSDFSKYIIMNGLPKCNEAKSLKFSKLLIKLFGAKKFNLEEGDIEYNWVGSGEEKMTTGQAFILMGTDEQAKIAAACFNGHELDKKHTFSSCTFPDFHKIMAAGEPEEGKEGDGTSFLELKDYMLHPSDDVYAYQQNKNVVLNKLFGQGKVLHSMPDEERLANIQRFNSDQPFLWSPKGTYMVLIKSDKVEFVGGSTMKPILTINEPKVETVIFSPCERYVMVYLPKNEMPYAVWNFVTHEKIREFEQEIGEDANTFKWCHDGNFIAKMVKKMVKVGEKKGEDGETVDDEVEKTYIRVYQLPDMVSCADVDGNKTPIPVNGLDAFLWMPGRNVLVYTAFPADENAKPRVTFQEMPSRKVLNIHTMNDSQQLDMYYHPQGQYLAVVNRYLDRKTAKYSVELFETKEGANLQQIPHQQVLINREVRTFHSVIWEPNHNKIAIHTLSKKVLEAGQKQFSNIDHMDVVDLYQLKNDALRGFRVNKMGTLPQDKIKEFYFSGAGNLFCTVEADSLTRTSLYFYMMSKQTNELPGQETDKMGLKKGQSAADPVDTYEFRKTGRYELKEKRYVAKWDENGRFFVVQGRKTTGFDKTGKSIRVFNMFGELLDSFDDMVGLDQIHFRPRARDVLGAAKQKKLKKNYKDKYLQMFKDEETQQKKERNDIERDKRKEVRDDFLNHFFMPLRRKYEADIDKYKALFPIKEKDMHEDEASYHSIYQHGETLSTRKLDLN